MSGIWKIRPGSPVSGVVSVLFTCDRRVFLRLSDGKIRTARQWERDEVLLEMLAWRDSAPQPGPTSPGVD